MKTFVKVLEHKGFLTVRHLLGCDQAEKLRATGRSRQEKGTRNVFTRLGQYIRRALVPAGFVAVFIFAPVLAMAAPYAALVMDERDGRVIYAENADARLHPASLTKMLTLYITFDAIRRGEITLDTPIKVTAHAAGQAPSRLGLRAGQVIALRYLIRAAAIKSANDAAAAIGDALGGSEAGFAERMNKTAKALGLTNSTFRNANGLTAAGHLSTARDMAILARHLYYDFPEYYNIFSRRESDAGIATVYSTNRKFLDEYQGADGLKTGFTVPSGFNLVATAQRGNKRLIGVIFGATSTPARNKQMAQLLDMGFAKVAEDVPVRKPPLPDLSGIAGGKAAPVAPAPRPDASDLVADATDGNPNGTPTTGKTVRVSTAVATSVTPRPRPESLDAGATAVAVVTPEARPATLAEGDTSDMADTAPAPRPAEDTQIAAAAAAPASEADGTLTNVATASATEVAPTPLPPAKPKPEIVFASVAPAGEAAPPPQAPEVVSRYSTSGSRDWAITLGRYPSRDAADKALLRVALAEPTTLDETLRKIVPRPSGFDATFVGLTQDQADFACRRIAARGLTCFTLSP